MKIRCAALLLAAAGSAGAVAGTLHVDAANPNCPGTGSAVDPFCAIQPAIAAAVNGDSILVAPGTYAGNLNFLGKSLALASTGGATATILAPVGTASTVSFASGEQGASIRGFTIRPGGGTPLSLPFPIGDVLAGGAILCLGAAVVIEQNVIAPPQNVGGGAGYGGGIFADGGTVEIRDNAFGGILGAEAGGAVYLRNAIAPSIIGNDVDAEDAARGVGLCLFDCTAPRIEDNVIHDNGTVFFGFNSNVGAGAYLVDCTAAVLRANSFLDNGCEDAGGGLCLENTDALVEDCVFSGNGTEFAGGALAAFGCAELTVRRCVFEDNSCGYEGGAMYVGCAPDQGVVVEDCLFAGNSGGIVDGVQTQSADHSFRRCTFVNHQSQFSLFPTGLLSGGAGAVVEDCVFTNNGYGLEFNGTIRRSTVAGNAYGGMRLELGELATIESSIFAGNGLVPADEIDVSGGGVAIVSDSLVLGGFPGTNVIGGDPKFVNAAGGDYRLLSSSPCIDAGAPSDGVCGVDRDGAPRRVSAAFLPPARVDMGAYEFRHASLAAPPTGPLAWQLATTGTAGLSTLLFAGLPSGVTCVAGAGTLLFDLGQPFVVVPWLPIPSSVGLSIPAVPGLPSQLVLQAAAIGPAGGANLSNAAILDLN